MHIVAFAGPSRPSKTDFAIDWRPPAAAGDLLSLIPSRPDRVVLIDGYFAFRPAPWHKEILLLLERGIPVIGAASMGALRAAELAPFGMIGVGSIFSAYWNGHLTADDEVAVLHAPRDMGWRPLTEPLVNIRANLIRAVRGKVISPGQGRAVLAFGTKLNFRDREWARLLEYVRTSFGSERCDALGNWLSSHRIDLKARDAAEAIEVARAGRLSNSEPVVTPRTCFLQRLGEHVGVDVANLV